MPSPPGSHRDLLHTEPIWHHSRWSLLLSPTSPGHGRHVLPQLSIAAMQCKACMPVHVSWQVIGTWSIKCSISKAALGMHPHRVSSPSHGTANPWISSSLHAWARLPRQSRQQRIHATGIQNSPKGTLNTSADVANITIRGVPCKPRKSWRRRRLFPPGITLSSGGLEPSRRLSALGQACCTVSGN